MRWILILCAVCAMFLPGLAEAKPKQAKAVIHTIRRGDSLSSIAKQYGTNVASICRWNAIKRTATLTPGKKIGVPLPPGARAPAEAQPNRPAGKTWKDYVKTPGQPGVVDLASYTDTWSGRVMSADGTPTAAALAAFEKLLGHKHSDATRVIDSRLIRLVMRVSDNFGGRKLHVVSGYRPGNRSRHAHGAAVDFRVEGVPNWAVRDYLLSLPDTLGVGYYPNSNHVHMDVRERSASWVDLSRPGQRARYVKPKRAAKKSARRKRRR